MKNKAAMMKHITERYNIKTWDAMKDWGLIGFDLEHLYEQDSNSLLAYTWQFKTGTEEYKWIDGKRQVLRSFIEQVRFPQDPTAKTEQR